MSRTVIFLGGLGHCAERLAPAQDVLKGMSEPSFNLIDVPYPGFEGRPMTSDWQDFQTEIAQQIAGLVPSNSSVIFYGTGIGAFVAFSLRAHGRFSNIPIILQGPVIWGAPEAARSKVGSVIAAITGDIAQYFHNPNFGRAVRSTLFENSDGSGNAQSLFQGFSQCRALPSLAAWLTPELLLETERRCEAQPDALNHITIWQGRHDRLASHEEPLWAEEALGVNWPIKTFETWDHYPMIDSPSEWIAAIQSAFDQTF